MAIHGVFISSKTTDGGEVDKILRGVFSEVYRVGVEFWLVDSGRSAEQVVNAVKPALKPTDKVFVAGLTRDVRPVLSNAAEVWLNAPQRTWRRTGAAGLGEVPSEGSPFAIAA
ncbi:MAG: hypothetical protein ROR55_18035 [Devosia sp.]